MNSMGSVLRGPITIIALSVIALLAAGCSQPAATSTTEEETTTTTQETTSTTQAKTGDAEGTKVVAQLSEYSITPDVTSVKTGQVTFTATNNGSETHELAVLKTDLAPGKLPVKNDVAAESGEGIENMGEVEDVEPGKSKEITLNLKPGKYVLICNVTSHYGFGMRTGLRVK